MAQLLVAERPPWAPPTFEIGTKDAATRALQDPTLLDSFFTRLRDICTLITAAASTSNADLSLAWQMVELKKVNVLVYGQTGAGKSTLIGELTGQSSLGGATTKQVSLNETPSGLCFIDRPGIDVPGAVGTNAEAVSVEREQAWFTSAMRSVSQWTNELARKADWKKTLADLDRRLKSNSAEDRPLALVYVHKSGNPRLYKEHIMQLLGKAHELLVPTFVVVADKWSADKQSREALLDQINGMITELGPNRRHRHVQCHVLSARPYESGSTVHPSVGIGEFLSSLLSHLGPEDAITFIRPVRFFRAAPKRPPPSAGEWGARRDGCVAAEGAAQEEEEEEGGAAAIAPPAAKKRRKSA